jgi:hypothetical protein
MRRNGVIGRATGYWLDDRVVGVQVSVGAGFSPLQVVQTISGTHPASYPMDTWGSFSGGKTVWAWSWPLTFN